MVQEREENESLGRRVEKEKTTVTLSHCVFLAEKDERRAPTARQARPRVHWELRNRTALRWMRASSQLLKTPLLMPIVFSKCLQNLFEQKCQTLMISKVVGGI